MILSEAGILDVAEAPPAANAAAALVGEFVPLHATSEDAKRRHIRRALERTGGSVMKTSNLLGISRRTLWEKLRMGTGSIHEADADYARCES